MLINKYNSIIYSRRVKKESQGTGRWISRANLIDSFHCQNGLYWTVSRTHFGAIAQNIYLIISGNVLKFWIGDFKGGKINCWDTFRFRAKQNGNWIGCAVLIGTSSKVGQCQECLIICKQWLPRWDQTWLKIINLFVFIKFPNYYLHWCSSFWHRKWPQTLDCNSPWSQRKQLGPSVRHRFYLERLHWQLVLPKRLNRYCQKTSAIVRSLGRGRRLALEPEKKRQIWSSYLVAGRGWVDEERRKMFDGEVNNNGKRERYIYKQTFVSMEIFNILKLCFTSFLYGYGNLKSFLWVSFSYYATLDFNIWSIWIDLMDQIRNETPNFISFSKKGIEWHCSSPPPLSLMFQNMLLVLECYHERKGDLMDFGANNLAWFQSISDKPA